MLEQRVERLEQGMGEIMASLVRLEAAVTQMSLTLAQVTGALSQMPKATDHAALRAEVAEIKGRVSNLPTVWQLITFGFTAMLSSAGLAIAMTRLLAS